MHSQNYDRTAQSLTEDLRAALNTVQSRHADVANHGIRPQRGDGLDERNAIRYRLRYFKIGRQKAAHLIQKTGVVVGDHQAISRRHGFGRMHQMEPIQSYLLPLWAARWTQAIRKCTERTRRARTQYSRNKNPGRNTDWACRRVSAELFLGLDSGTGGSSREEEG